MQVLPVCVVTCSVCVDLSLYCDQSLLVLSQDTFCGRPLTPQRLLLLQQLLQSHRRLILKLLRVVFHCSILKSSRFQWNVIMRRQQDNSSYFILFYLRLFYFILGDFIVFYFMRRQQDDSSRQQEWDGPTGEFLSSSLWVQQRRLCSLQYLCSVPRLLDWKYSDTLT